jgi:hypothetical protein
MRKENANSSTDNAATEPGQEEDFLGRWSRRKQRARRESADAAPPQPPAPSPEEQPDGASDEEAQEQPLTDVDMPPLESLGEDSDYSGFLSPGVSDKLRRVALKKLFSSPYFNVRDGLDDYDEDFRNFEALGDIITSDMRHQMEQEAERAKQAANEEPGEPPLEETQLAASADDAGEEIPADADEEIPADKQAAPGETDPGDARVSEDEADPGDAQVSEGETESPPRDAPDSEPTAG